MRFILALLFILSLQPVCADSIKSVAEIKSLSEKIMQHFTRDEFVKGLDIAKQYWPLPPVEIDGLANQINTQWSIVKQRFGNTTGYELVRVDRLGSSFVRMYYLHKFDNHAIYWRFTFYKPVDSWKVNGITFQDGLDFLFETVN